MQISEKIFQNHMKIKKVGYQISDLTKDSKYNTLQHKSFFIDMIDYNIGIGYLLWDERQVLKNERF